jgi:hypothetical protein
LGRFAGRLLDCRALGIDQHPATGATKLNFGTPVFTCRRPRREAFAMNEPRLPRPPVVLAAMQPVSFQLVRDRAQLDCVVQLGRVAAREPRAVLGVVAYWLGLKT